MTETDTILVRVQGPDHPGVLAGLLRIIAESGAAIEDVEQVVIRRRLTLGIVTAVPAGRDLVKELLLYGWEKGVDLDFEVVEPQSPGRDLGLLVTVIGRKVSAAALASVAEGIAKVGANVERIERLSRYPVMSYELTVSGSDVDGLRQNLLPLAQSEHFDIAVQREGLGRRAQRLVVMDVDSTLIIDEAVELLAAEAGVEPRVAEITARSMAGEIDFESSLRERVALLAGLDRAAVDRAKARLTLTPGARTFVRTLKRLGYSVAVVSGGFTEFTALLTADLDLDYAYANTLEWSDGRLTGGLVGPIVDRSGKARLLREIAALEGVTLEQTVAIGDGANDLDMLAAAGLGIAFNAKAVVREAADASLSVPYLDAVLFVLGISRLEVEAADRAAGDEPHYPEVE